MSSCAFLPTAARVERLDTARHIDLADSLGHVAQACAEVFPDIAALVASVVSRIKAGDRLGSAAFGCYFELVEALGVDDATRASEAARQLATIDLRSEQPVVRGRGAPDNRVLDAVIDQRMGRQFRLSFSRRT